ncbi:MAG: hypothetical protein JW940_09735 [Polyangiaceae bacterium]|nr:hypothetical protein [Polyangiaceae bacterium]
MDRFARCTSFASRPRLLPWPIPLPLSILLFTMNAKAADYYVDPSVGLPSGDGSQDEPWQTLEAVVEDGHFTADIRAGDTVWLRSGDHGAFAVSGGDYAPPITVAAEAGETPQLRQVSFNGTNGWIVRGLSISPSYGTSPSAVDMVLVDKTSSDVAIEDCRLFSVADASSWDATEWVNSASNGIFIRGDHIRASRNILTNVRFGISVDGPNALVEYNQIVNFSADGIRGLGDNGVYQYNLVKNVYVDGDSGDDNHDDGFQSWSVGPDGPGTGVVRGVVLRGNVFVNREDPAQKLTNSMQGIGCFDGLFDDWVVENNVVVTDHWHGISFYGMRDSRVVNNTVIDVNDVSPGPPWIMVTAHKDGTPSENVLVRNNLATDFDLTGTALVADHNTTLDDLTSFFVDPAAFDLHLLADAPAVDSGSSEQVPERDADGIARPQGNGVDLGAYEWHEPSVVPAGGGSGGSNGPAAGRGGVAATGGASASDSGAGGSTARVAGGGAGAPTGTTAAQGEAGARDGTADSRGGAAANDGSPATGGGARSPDAVTAGNGHAGTYGEATAMNGEAGGAGAADTSSSEAAGGCGCRLATRAPTQYGFALLAMVAALVLRRRPTRAAFRPVNSMDTRDQGA